MSKKEKAKPHPSLQSGSPRSVFAGETPDVPCGRVPIDAGKIQDPSVFSNSVLLPERLAALPHCTFGTRSWGELLQSHIRAQSSPRRGRLRVLLLRQAVTAVFLHASSVLFCCETYNTTIPLPCQPPAHIYAPLADSCPFSLCSLVIFAGKVYN